MKVLQEQLRPKSFAEIKGLDYSPTGGRTHREALEYMAENDTAFCITLIGPPGTGKTSTAYVFIAKYLGVTVDELISGGNPNFKSWNASGDRGIDVIRDEVRPWVAYGTENEKRRIVLMEEAGGLTNVAWKAMKNIVEEFSFNCIFIFTMNEKGGMEDANLSRNYVIEYDPISLKDFEEWFKKAAEFSGITYTADIPKQLWKYYRGDLRAVISNILSPFENSNIVKFQPKKTYAEEIYKATDSAKKYLEIASEHYIDPFQLLEDLYILNGCRNINIFKDGVLILERHKPPMIPMIYVLENMKK